MGKLESDSDSQAARRMPHVPVTIDKVVSWILYNRPPKHVAEYISDWEVKYEMVYEDGD